jgi:hypothetical protein
VIVTTQLNETIDSELNFYDSLLGNVVMEFICISCLVNVASYHNNTLGFRDVGVHTDPKHYSL